MVQVTAKSLPQGALWVKYEPEDRRYAQDKRYIYLITSYVTEVAC